MMLIILLVILVLLVLAFLFTRGKGKKEPKPAAKPTSGGDCMFEGEDVFNKHVYKNTGELVEDEETKVACDDCGDYVYKMDDSCYDMIFDQTYNDSKNSGVCTAKTTSDKCPF